MPISDHAFDMVATGTCRHTHEWMIFRVLGMTSVVSLSTSD